ncbi:MAG: hypothetical protein AB7I13_13060 [Vicinamibacterales bacterium]
MRRNAFGLLLGLLLAGVASTATAQVLPSTPFGPGFVTVNEAAGRIGDIQLTVEVVGAAPVIAGAPGEHFLTFHEPLQVPGAALEPGTYVFHLVAPSVMQVRTVDRTRSMLFMVRPLARIEAHDEYRLVLRHVEGGPPRLTELYVPQMATGLAPVYGEPSSCERILRRLNLPTTACFG